MLVTAGEGTLPLRGMFGDDPQGRLRVIDCRRLGSPWSTVRVAATLATAAAGEILEILSIDPSDLGDIAACCRARGARVLSAHSLHGIYVIRIESGEQRSVATAR